MEQNMVLKLMRVREGAIIPKQATAGSAGYDLCACIDAPQTIEPGERCVFPSGLAAEIPAGTAGFVFTRSGLGIKKGIAQMIIMPYFAPVIEEVTSLTETDRGAGGFGSTGTK